MAAISPRLASVLILAFASNFGAPSARAAEGTVTVSAGVAPRLAVQVEVASPAEPTSLDNGLALEAIVVRVESNTPWTGSVAVETSGALALPPANVQLVGLVPVPPRAASQAPPIDVGITAVRWTTNAPAGRSMATYRVVLLAAGGLLLPAPLTLVFVVTADGGNETTVARIDIGHALVPQIEEAQNDAF